MDFAFACRKGKNITMTMKEYLIQFIENAINQFSKNLDENVPCPSNS